MLQTPHENANHLLGLGPQDELLVGHGDEGAPLAGFHIAQVVEQVDGLANAAGAA